ncbi:hypothetical protein ALI144C_50020 [Actinosynnema sp. ALI-1.44]|uniref:hypothetical protein n=1 Tax=Actinosynnema sp. ALI-1.44 TaxID=1933779 RepID=UPI00097C46A4|nr:hypothetical protein [Actinosynnema sp. ALI-1.44]ONI70746.1 hypothetical protein ALI144C_50020 [Actinosynnema sp. ALI-1.44]
MRRILLGIGCGLLLAACGSGNGTAQSPVTTTPSSEPPATTASKGPMRTGTKTASTGVPAVDNSCGPVEICGKAEVAGGQTLSTDFFTVLSELNNKSCADWAAGSAGKLALPKVTNSERTLNFFTEDPIAYSGPASYTDAALLKEATLQVNSKTYTTGDKGQSEVTMAENGSGSITLTDWSAEDGDKVTAKIYWSCTDR